MASNRSGRIFIQIPEALPKSFRSVRIGSGALEVNGHEFTLLSVSQYQPEELEFSSEGAVELDRDWFEVRGFGRGDMPDSRDKNPIVVEVTLI